MAQRPAERRAHVPPGGEIVSLLGIHVHVAAVHRDHARHTESPRGHDRGGARGDRPVRVHHVRPTGPSDRHRRPVLRLHVMRHDREPGEPAQQAHLPLRHPAIGQIRGELHRKPDYVHPVEAVLRRERPVARRDHGDLVATTRQVAVDVVDVGRLRVVGVLRVPVCGANDAQRGSRPPWARQGHFRRLDLECPSCHRRSPRKYHVTRSSEGCRKFNIHATWPVRETLGTTRRPRSGPSNAETVQHPVAAPVPYRSPRPARDGARWPGGRARHPDRDINRFRKPMQ
jgi:hypothetical protein